MRYYWYTCLIAIIAHWTLKSCGSGRLKQWPCLVNLVIYATLALRIARVYCNTFPKSMVGCRNVGTQCCVCNLCVRMSWLAAKCDTMSATTVTAPFFLRHASMDWEGQFVTELRGGRVDQHDPGGKQHQLFDVADRIFTLLVRWRRRLPSQRREFLPPLRMVGKRWSFRLTQARWEAGAACWSKPVKPVTSWEGTLEWYEYFDASRTPQAKVRILRQMVLVGRDVACALGR